MSDSSRAEMRFDVKFDVEEMADRLSNEQLRAVMMGLAQVLAASRTQHPMKTEEQNNDQP